MAPTDGFETPLGVIVGKAIHCSKKKLLLIGVITKTHLKPERCILELKAFPKRCINN